MNICVCLLIDDIHSFLLGVSLAVGLLGPGADSQSFKEISPSPNNEGKETAFQRTSKEMKMFLLSSDFFMFLPSPTPQDLSP